MVFKEPDQENSRDESNRLPVSVCITTRNNADTIRQCLESVHQWTDEIIVVDTDSCDGTLEICKEFGANMYQHEFRGLSYVKRKAMDYADNEWVFVLDADEVVPERLREEITAEFGSPGTVAFYMRKQEHMLGELTRQYHFKRPYLAKKEVIYYQQKYIWERLSVRDNCRSHTRTLSNAIIHYRFDRASGMEAKAQQYSSLEAIQIVESNGRDGAISLLTRAIAVALSRLIIDKAVLDGYRGLFIAFMEFYQIAVAYIKVQDIYRLQERYPEDWKEIWLTEECQR
jgi:glycosyltransferase involved in cell wall biosynthesis